MPSIQQLLKDPFQLLVPLVFLAATILAGLLVRSLLFRRCPGMGAAHGEQTRSPHCRESARPDRPLVDHSRLASCDPELRNPARLICITSRGLSHVLWILSLTMAMSRLAGNAVRFYGGHVTGSAVRYQPDAETGATRRRGVGVRLAPEGLRRQPDARSSPLSASAVSLSLSHCKTPFRTFSPAFMFRYPAWCTSAITSN